MQAEPMPTDNGLPPDSEKAADERNRQASLLRGILGGIITGIVAAIIWATVAYVTNMKIGWLAIGIGFLVGIGIRFLGKGSGTPFQIAGAIIAVAACVLGDYFTIITFASKELGVGIMDIMTNMPFSIVIDAMKESTGPIDFLFYAISGWFGWKYSSPSDT